MSEELRFDGRVAIVTGAGAGLGRAHALLLAARGAKVVVNDLGCSTGGAGADASPAEKVVAEIEAAGGEAVANFDSVEDGAKIVECALDSFGKLDIVINNAGILRDASFQKMTDEEWDIIQRVHLRGSYSVTRAAWEHLRNNNYGRVLFTSSGAGVYGNFGQANYSSAKMGLIGLSNTLAVEGAKKNILVNTLVPAAGSRLTATVLPPDLVAVLQPEFISPLVAVLCHESSRENGGVFEAGAGWFARLRWERTRGVFFPLDKPITPEAVAAALPEINNWKNNTREVGFSEMMNKVLGIVARNKQQTNDTADPQRAIGYQFEPGTFAYDERDVSLYALGVGAARNPLDARELPFVYERDKSGFKTLPTFGVLFMNGMLTMETLAAIPGLKLNPALILHGEQELEIKRPLPAAATVRTEAKIAQVYDKGKGALIIIEAVSRDESGAELAVNHFSLFARGIGGWGGERGPANEENAAPERPADITVKEKINDNQALLYRLSGDLNPLHADPTVAASVGFEKPILHGLCVFGIAGRVVLQACCDNDVTKFKRIKARFAKPTFPGETLIVEMWRAGEQQILFRCKVAERNEYVLTNGLVELQ